MEKMHIELKNGSMEIHLDGFFPCSQRKFRHLMKVINEFRQLNDVQYMVQQMNTHFRRKIAELEIKMKNEGSMYWRWKQLYADLDRMLESGKQSNGIPLTKEELDGIKEKRKEAKEYYSGFERSFKQHGRRLEAYKKNIEMLERVG